MSKYFIFFFTITKKFLFPIRSSNWCLFMYMKSLSIFMPYISSLLSPTPSLNYKASWIKNDKLGVIFFPFEDITSFSLSALNDKVLTNWEKSALNGIVINLQSVFSKSVFLLDDLFIFEIMHLYYEMSRCLFKFILGSECFLFSAVKLSLIKTLPIIVSSNHHISPFLPFSTSENLLF